MKRFEFITLSVQIDDSVVDALNEMGQDGWDPIDIRRFRHFTEILLKREVTPESGGDLQ